MPEKYHEIKPEDPEKLLNEIDNMIQKQASFPSKDASYKHTGPMSTKKTATTYGNTEKIMDETVSIPGSLSAVSVGGEKKNKETNNVLSIAGIKETMYKSVLDVKLNSCGCKKKREK